jgi:hypothetical protein
MSTAVTSLIEQRANILAMVEFTSRPDLQVSSFPGDAGLDLIVRVLTGGTVYQKFLGVTLKGTNRVLSSAEEATRYHKSVYRKNENKPLPKYSFPVVALLFSMPNDRGYYSWLIEPIIHQTKQPRLKVHEDISCAVFDRKALDVIVKKVNDWHDKLFALLGET